MLEPVRQLARRTSLPTYRKPLVPDKGIYRYGGFALHFMDYGRMYPVVRNGGMLVASPRRIEFLHEAMGLCWGLKMDRDGGLIGLDGRRIKVEGVEANLNGSELLNIPFFTHALGLDGSMVRTREMIEDPVDFTSRFMIWSRRPERSFRWAFKTRVPANGVVRLETGERTIPFTTNKLRDKYAGRTTILVPLGVLGQPVVYAFDAKGQECIGEREYDVEAGMLFYRHSHHPQNRLYNVMVKDDHHFVFADQRYAVGTERHPGELLRVVTDDARHIERVLAANNSHPLAGSASLGLKDVEGQAPVVGRINRKDRLAREGEGTGTAQVKRLMQKGERGEKVLFGFQLNRTEVYFAKADVEKYGIQVGQVVEFRHENGVVTEVKVGKGRILYVLNSAVTPEKMTIIASYRRGVPRADLEGVHLIEGLKFSHRDRWRQSILYGRGNQLTITVPPFGSTNARVSVVTKNGGDPLFFRDVRRFGREDRELAQTIAAVLSGRKFNNRDPERRAEYLREGEKLAENGQKAFLTTEHWEKAEAAFLQAYRIYPKDFRPLKRVREMRRAIILRKQYLSHRQRLTAQVVALFAKDINFGIVKFMEFLASENTNALMAAHAFEIIVGISEGRMPGDRSLFGKVRDVLPLLFLNPDGEYRKVVIGALKILQDAESTASIPAEIVAQLPPEFHTFRWRLIHLRGIRTENGQAMAATNGESSQEIADVARAIRAHLLNGANGAEAEQTKNRRRTAIRIRVVTSQRTLPTRVEVSQRLKTLSARCVTFDWNTKVDMMVSMRSLCGWYDELVGGMRSGQITVPEAWKELAKIYADLERNWGAIESYRRIRIGGELKTLYPRLVEIRSEGVFQVQAALLNAARPA